MNAEQRHLAEILRVRKAMRRTDSKKLKRDYKKYLKSLMRDLYDYRNFRKESQC